MPHIILEYSNNVGRQLDCEQLLTGLHHALSQFETFEYDRIKSRAIPVNIYVVGQSDTAFLHTTVAFSQGRSKSLREKIGNRLLEEIQIVLTDAHCRAQVAHSVEIRQFEENMYFRD